MPAFVIQKHEKQGEPVHWDLMLERGEVLKTFRLDRPPEQLVTEHAIAAPIFDHDKRFLTFEGTVNRGLGTVQIVERGRYQTLSQTDTAWSFTLEGSVLQGRFTLKVDDNNRWTFGKE